jgi:hypothetical protein
VFGEPNHRTIAEYLADIEPGNSKLVQPNPVTKGLQKAHRGTFLLYPVRETEGEKVSIGFELFFPENNIPFDLNLTVRRKAERDQVTVPAVTSS